MGGDKRAKAFGDSTGKAGDGEPGRRGEFHRGHGANKELEKGGEGSQTSAPQRSRDTKCGFQENACVENWKPRK